MPKKCESNAIPLYLERDAPLFIASFIVQSVDRSELTSRLNWKRPMIITDFRFFDKPANVFLWYFCKVKCSSLKQECIIWTRNIVPFYYSYICFHWTWEKKCTTIPYILFFALAWISWTRVSFLLVCSSRLNIYDLSAYLYEVQMGSSTSYSKCFNERLEANSDKENEITIHVSLEFLTSIINNNTKLPNQIALPKNVVNC